MLKIQKRNQIGECCQIVGILPLVRAVEAFLGYFNMV